MKERINKFLDARKQAQKLSNQQQNQLSFARRFLAKLLTSYFPLTTPPPVDPLENNLAEEMGVLAETVDTQMAAYFIGTTYTAMLPSKYRGQYGVFYTPPALVERLLDLAEKSGVNWSTAKILDPACGGGAFLSPVIQRILAASSHLTPEERLSHIETHLTGVEIDPFSAWISQVFIEIMLQGEINKAGRRLKSIVKVCDSLNATPKDDKSFDLVIGNPPYGRIKLSKEERVKWKRSLYGHANLYGLFSDLAARLVRPEGIIAYVTPTSFLGGQYYQALRGLLGREAPPVAIDFIARREGVFSDVLQETLLAVYKKQDNSTNVSISHLSVKETGISKIQQNGSFPLPDNPEEPWILPRTPAQSLLAYLACYLPTRLYNLGYTVATGPLVWNRHKEKLFASKVKGAIPLIWAECVDSGGTGMFRFKATGRGHVPWYKPGNQKDANVVKIACVLLQRTTAIEQSRRLIAAELPQDFIEKNGGAVTVENHLNMIRPIAGTEPKIPPKVIAVLLNSKTVDLVFRCINGSTAVSAYELEALPLPSLQECRRIEALLDNDHSKNEIETAIQEMYYNVRITAAA